MKLQGIISVDFSVTDELDKKTGKETGSTMGLYISYLYTSRRAVTVRRKVLYNILSNFSISIKLVRLIKMCLNKTHSKVHLSKYANDLKQEYALSPLLFNFPYH